MANSEITLKITSHYENVQAITGVGKESKLFYRISDMDGNPFAPCNIDEVSGIVRIVGIREVSKHYE